MCSSEVLFNFLLISPFHRPGSKNSGILIVISDNTKKDEQTWNAFMSHTAAFLPLQADMISAILQN